MISLAPFLALRQIVFFVWVSLSEQKWVILAERRGEVPPREIDQALDRKQLVEADFEKFTFRPE
jgi:hypothetical protein